GYRHKGSVGGAEFYITGGLFESGQPGEVFFKLAKEGSTLSGFADAFACVFSLALQYGVPLEVMLSKLAYTRFEPSGFTNNKAVPQASSIIDYFARWMR